MLDVFAGVFTVLEPHYFRDVFQHTMKFMFGKVVCLVRWPPHPPSPPPPSFAWLNRGLAARRWQSEGPPPVS